VTSTADQPGTTGTDEPGDRRFDEPGDDARVEAALRSLPNRRDVAHLLDQAGSGCPVMLDLAGFAYLNEEVGHQAGDRVLLACSQALRAVFPDGTVVARTGGDEFAVLTPGAGELDGPAMAVRAVESVVTAMEKLDTGRWTPDARCGWAAGPGPGEGLLRAAEADLVRRLTVEGDRSRLRKYALRLAALASGPMHYLDVATLVVPPVLPNFDSEPGGAAWPELEERGLVRTTTGHVAWSRPGEEQQLYELTDLGAAEGPYWLLRWRQQVRAAERFLAAASSRL
jgi:diguanylate cyclase (GGDEF)-like protein